MKDLARGRALICLALLIGLTTWARAFTPEYTIAGIAPGMTRHEVEQRLGTADQQGRERPFLGEAPGGTPEIAWWLSYFRHGEFVHVGLEAREGTVVMLAGSTLEHKGLPILDRKGPEAAINKALGPSEDGWSADACYHEYAGGVLVRGCAGGEDFIYYLRDWDAVAKAINDRYRQAMEQEFARMHPSKQRHSPSPSRDRLSIQGVSLALPESALDSLGLPWHGPGRGEPEYVTHWELGDPRPQPSECVRVTCAGGQTVFLIGSYLEREGRMLVKEGDHRSEVERVLGPPARSIPPGFTGGEAALIYPEDLLVVYLDGEGLVTNVSLGDQPDDHGYPPAHSQYFTVGELEAATP